MASFGDCASIPLVPYAIVAPLLIFIFHIYSSDPDLFATTGDDKTIRIWSVSARRLLRKAVIDCSARSVNWSPDGHQLIVGLGGSSDGKKQRKDGAFLMLDAASMKPLFEGRYLELSRH